MIEVLSSYGVFQQMWDLGVGRLAVNLSHAELLFGLVDAPLSNGDGLPLFVDLEVIATHQTRPDSGELVVVTAAFHRRTADNQRCASLVDEDVVNLVNYRELPPTLVPLI